jgi:hypothetical protein
MLRIDRYTCRFIIGIENDKDFQAAIETFSAAESPVESVESFECVELSSDHTCLFPSWNPPSL